MHALPSPFSIHATLAVFTIPDSPAAFTLELPPPFPDAGFPHMFAPRIHHPSIPLAYHVRLTLHQNPHILHVHQTLTTMSQAFIPRVQHHAAPALGFLPFARIPPHSRNHTSHAVSMTPHHTTRCTYTTLPTTQRAPRQATHTSVNAFTMGHVNKARLNTDQVPRLNAIDWELGRGEHVLVRRSRARSYTTFPIRFILHRFVCSVSFSFT